MPEKPQTLAGAAVGVLATADVPRRSIGPAPKGRVALLHALAISN